MEDSSAIDRSSFFSSSELKKLPDGISVDNKHPDAISWIFYKYHVDRFVAKRDRCLKKLKDADPQSAIVLNRELKEALDQLAYCSNIIETIAMKSLQQTNGACSVSPDVEGDQPDQSPASLSP